MATIRNERRERRGRRGMDMGMLMGMLEQYGPGANERREQQRLQTMMMQRQLAQDEQRGPLQQQLLQAQLDAIRQAESRAGAVLPGQQAAQAAEVERMNLGNASAGRMAGVSEAQASVNLAEQLQKMQAEELRQKQMAEAGPLLQNKLALDNLMMGAEAASKGAQPDLARREQDLRGLAMFRSLQGDGVQMDPAMMAEFGVQPPPPAQAPAEFMSRLEQALMSDPTAALNIYGQAPPNLQGLVPLSPEDKVSMAAGVTPEQIIKLFRKKPAQTAYNPSVPPTWGQIFNTQ